MVDIPPQSADESSPTFSERMDAAEMLPDGIEKFRALNAILMPIFGFATEEAFTVARRMFAVARAVGDAKGMAFSTENIGHMHLFLGNNASALRYLRRALRSYDALREDVPWYARALHGAANACEGLGRFAEAIDYYGRSIEVGRATNDVERIAAGLNGISEVYRILGDHERALALAMETVPLWERIGNHRGLGVAYNNIGIIHCAMNDGTYGIEEYEKSIQHYAASNDQAGMAIAMANAGRSYVDAGRVEQGMEYLTRALAVHRATGFQRNEAGVLNLLGLALLKQGRPTEAIDRMREGLEVYERIEFQSGICEARTDMAAALLRLGRHEEAIEALMGASDLAGAIGYRLQAARANRLLAEAYESRGDLDAALVHVRRFMAEQEALLSEETRRTVAAMQVRLDVERAERDREIFRLEAVRLKREMQLRSKELEAMAMRLAQMNEVMAGVRREIIVLARADVGEAQISIDRVLERLAAAGGADAAWKQFEEHLERLSPGHMQALQERFAELTPTELKVCTLLGSNLTSKDIANLLNLSTHTVETHRRRIRKKLSLSPETNLTMFMMEAVR